MTRKKLLPFLAISWCLLSAAHSQDYLTETEHREILLRLLELESLRAKVEVLEIFIARQEELTTRLLEAAEAREEASRAEIEHLKRIVELERERGDALGGTPKPKRFNWRWLLVPAAAAAVVLAL